jgi:GT2 family glycosyltransferase
MCLIAIIVTFNRLDKLELTIQKSLEECFDKIIIVNNNSTDSTKEYLDSLDNNRLIVKHLNKNLGGAGGFNVGFDIALNETDADWIVCYDDDACPDVGMIEKFKTLELEETISSVAAAVYLPNGDVSVMNKVRFNPFKSVQSFVNTFVKRESIYVSEEVYRGNSILEIDASTFVGFFIRTDVVRKMGLPRTELFIYADDLIYTLGLTMSGYKHLFVPSITFTHDCTTLVNANDVYDPIWKVYYTYRNRIEMYRVSSKWLYLPITLLQIIPWRRKKKYYQNQELYLILLKMAIVDALKSDFTKSHTDILKIVEQYEN